MLAGQKSTGNNGLQNALFPLEYMYITQGENGSTSHQGSDAIDFMGYGPNGRVYKCPFYAPCDLICAAKMSDSSVWWHSINEVNFSSGNSGYLTIVFIHDDNWNNNNIGDIKRQGDLLGNTGTAGNVTGDHVHIECAKSLETTYVQNEFGVYVVKNSTHVYDCLGVNNTVMINDYGYLWRIFSQTPTTFAETGLIRLYLTGTLNWGYIKEN